MFVRKLKSKNSKVYIQVVDKSSCRYRVVKSFGGVTSKTDEIRFVSKANEWIKQQRGISEFDFTDTDSGLLSKSNVETLQEKGYEFVLGARIKAESQAIKEQILALNHSHGESALIKKGNLKLIITYSDDRAKKDRYNREKGLSKLEKQIQRGRLTKANITNRGYNTFLKLEGEIKVAIE